MERTLVSSTWHGVRFRLAAFTKQRDNTKRSQRLRCYRGRHEYSKTRGSRVSGRRMPSRRGVNGTNDRHFMNREPLSIERARAPTSPWAPSSGPLAGAGSGPGGSDVNAVHDGARAGSAQLTYRDVSAVAGAIGSRPTAPLRRRNRTRMRRYQYPQKCARSLPCE